MSTLRVLLAAAPSQSRPAAWALFTSPEFLAIAAFLGAASTAVYLISKSLWPPVLLHWTAVLTWATQLACFWLGLQVFAHPRVRARFLQAVFYFGFG